jgi:hypothetical protein
MSESKPYTVLAPSGATEQSVMDTAVAAPFEESCLRFIDAISLRVLSDKVFRRYPELMAMAFWMRRANIHKIGEQFREASGKRLWRGRGIVFHIAPSNVDSIFIYSWFLSMLVGNRNIVRLSSSVGEQVLMLVQVINELAMRPEHAEIARRFLLVQYEHNDETTAHLSALCDVRVIWGGDETVRRIRAIPLRPSATELVFADKFSIGAINAGSFLALENKQALIDRFFNDAYWFGQNACSSPRLVVWIGESQIVDQARPIFWNLLGRTVSAKLGPIPAAVAMNKKVAIDSVIISARGRVRVEPSESSQIDRMLITNHDDINRGLHCGGGLFYEFCIGKLEELAGLLSKKDQTVASFGITAEEWRQFIRSHRPSGVDRIVPIGDALTFSAIWDGYDLMREFCREVDITVAEGTGTSD